MGSVKIALAAGLVITAAAAGTVLSQAPLVVLATNRIAPTASLETIMTSGKVCQAREVLPRGTRAIRLGLYAFTGPEVQAEAVSDGHILASGEHNSGWSAATVTVPVHPVPRTSSPVEICFQTPSPDEGVVIYGAPTNEAVAARAGEATLHGRMTVEYMGRGRSSWLSLASSVAHQMAFGRAWSGTWVAFLIAGLMLAASAVTSGLILRELHD